MTTNGILRDHLMSASPSAVRPRCSGSSNISGKLSSPPVPPPACSASWYSQTRALFLLLLVALVASPVTVSAAPATLRSSIDGRHQRRQNPSNTQGSGSISMSIWLPILLVTIVFGVFSFVACLRRRAAAASTIPTTVAANSSGGNTTRPLRQPRRTPSQISTKSLPPYMKDPGDHELVLYRGPSETEDDEHPAVHDTTFDIALDRIESVDTMADSSTTNLIHRVSESVARPPELHHVSMPHDHRRSADANSGDSIGSETELLPAHRRDISAGSHADPRGETPSYTEAVSVSATAVVSLNDPEPNNVSSNSPSNTASRGHSRFSFLRHNPFSSHNVNGGAPSNANQPPSSTRPASPAPHAQNGSALSRFSSHESHESHHSRSSSRNNFSHSHSRSSSNLFRALRSHSPGLNAGSSTISLDSISAPLTHTLTRAEFHAPKGGLLTPEQVKLITSREALERFGVPYGPDAVAAFSLSRERLTEAGPPPDFESVVGEHEERPDASSNETSGGITEEVTQRSATSGPELEAVIPRSLSPSASAVVSRTTTPETNATGLDLTVQTDASGDENEADGLDDPQTARPMTPGTARPLSLSGDHPSVAGHA